MSDSTAPQQALSLIRDFEGCVLDAYPDPASVLGRTLRAKGMRLSQYKFLSNWPLLSGAPWTIGWGHAEGVNPGDSISQADADRLLELEVTRHLAAVRQLVAAAPRELADYELAALTSFEYNEGEGSLKKSTLLARILAGDFAGAADEFAKWDIAGGSVEPGLVARRQTEATVFRGGEG